MTEAKETESAVGNSSFDWRFLCSPERKQSTPTLLQSTSETICASCDCFILISCGSNKHFPNAARWLFSSTTTSPAPSLYERENENEREISQEMVMSTDQNSLSIPSCRLYSTFTACSGERLNLHKPAVMTMDCTSRYINAWREGEGGRWQEPKDVSNSLSFVAVLVRRVLNWEISHGGTLQRKDIWCPGPSSLWKKW